MPTPKRGPRLGGGAAHQKMMMSNLASDLFRHGRIKTTEAKAKMLRPYAEKLITKAKAGDLPARRAVLSKLRDRDVVAYLFEDVAPRFADRNGGYTRILKLGPRPGDNAPMAIIELVEQSAERGEDIIEEGKRQRSRGLFGRRAKNVGGTETVPSFGTGGAQTATIEDATDTSADELGDELGTEDDGTSGLAAQAPEGEDAPEAPLDTENTSDPVGPTDDPDAGKGTGKDASNS